MEGQRATMGRGFGWPTSRGLSAAALILILAGGFLGWRGLWEPDEGRYVNVALQMLSSGDWIHPEMHDEQPHYAKPPLTYWLLAASLGVFGRQEWAARLPNAVAFVLTAWSVAWLARRLVPGRQVSAALIYASSILPFIAVSCVTADTILCFWETLAMAGFVMAWRRLDPLPSGASATADPKAAPARPLRASGLLLMWSALGLGFLTKGPPALVPLLAVVPCLGIVHGWRGVIGLFHPLAVLVFVVLAGSWFVVVVAENPALGRYFLMEEVVHRVFTGQHRRNSQWYMAGMYVPILVGGLLPWSVDWFRRWDLYRWSRIREHLQNPPVLLLVLWVAVPLVVFSLARSRLPLYVLPLTVPLALLTARLQPMDWLSRPPTWAFLGGWTVGLLLIRIILAIMPSSRDARNMAASFPMEPITFQEIVFVDQRPLYGLRFYMNLPVERVELQPGASETLEEELQDEPGNFLLVVPVDKWPTVRKMLQDHRRSGRYLGLFERKETPVVVAAVYVRSADP